MEDIKKRKRVIDLFNLPLCRSSLKLHARRSNYILKIWRQADQKIMVYESSQQHRWNEDYSLELVDEVFSTDFAKHLDARDIECDYDTDSDDEDGLECDEDDFDQKWLQDIKLKFFYIKKYNKLIQLA